MQPCILMADLTLFFCWQNNFLEEEKIFYSAVCRRRLFFTAMRRRSERKKSTSPAPLPARRSRRSRKVSDNERTEEENSVAVHKDAENQEVPQAAAASREEINDAQDRERASSEEQRAASPSPVRKSRSSRTTPKKRVDSKSVDKKVETIPEEGENGADSDKWQSSRNNANVVKPEKRTPPQAADSVEMEPKSDAESVADTQPKTEPKADVEMPKPEPGNAKKDVDKSDDEKPTADDDDDADDDDGRQRIHKQEVKVPSPSISLTASKEEEHLKTSSDVLDIQTEDVEERDDEAAAAAAATEDTPKSERREERKRKHKEQLQERIPIKTKDEQKENRKQSAEQPAPAEDEAIDNKHETSVTATPPTVASAGAAATVLQSQRSVRKRKWLTNKKSSDRAPPVLAISTDSLKNIISDVVPVPLSDVQLDSSSEEEGLVTSDHETDRSVSPVVRKERERECDESGTVTVVTANDSSSVAESNAAKEATAGTGRTTPALATDIVQVHIGGGPSKSTVPSAKPNVVRSPSPARNRSSHVLYITNLVRPFTVLQLKGLLARTGKIVEDGFWIDRIKSKCFVAYSNEDEAIETRHALHGVRWPVSNPKCLNVDFGSRTDMDRAIQLTKDEPPRYGQENTRDNQQSGNTWSRLDATDKKPARPVREWDVGKKEPNDRDKVTNDRRRGSKERALDSRSRDVEGRPGQDRKRSREGDGIRGRERERNERNNDRNAHGRSRSGSPLPKTKRKENEPPIRLLDDLFRKTKGTPCIYWLPLTPEAIAEKEAFRQKRIEEHKLRIKEREDRQKERDKDRDRQRDTRRNRSNERRHSRSRERERRRY